MPAYNQPYGHYPDYYNGSANTLPEETMYEDEYGSTAHLTSSAAPIARGAEDNNSLAPSYQSYPTQGYHSFDPAAHHGGHAPAAAYGQAYPHETEMAYGGEASPEYPNSAQPMYRSNTPMDHAGHDRYYGGHGHAI